MSRPSRQQMFMRIAQVVSERSTCARLNVGAVITLDNRIISMGWNGQQPGEDHCAGAGCAAFHTPGTCGTKHAEHNALERMPLGGGGPGRLAMYVTDSPCQACAEMIAAMPLDDVYFSKAYRDTDPLMYLVSQDVNVYQVTPAGFVIDWFKKEIIAS